MAYKHIDKSSGNLIQSSEWNAIGHELERLEADKVNRAGDTIQGELKVTGKVEFGNSDLYFTRTDHRHSGLGNNDGFAAIENDGGTYDALMILGRAHKNGRRTVKLWDYLEVNGELRVNGPGSFAGPGTFENGLTVKANLEVGGDLKVSGNRLRNAGGFGILQANANDWLRVNPDSQYPGIALYKSTAIGEGGLAIGEWAQLGRGELKVTGTATFTGAVNISGPATLGNTRLGGFSGEEKDEWPFVTWYRDPNAGWDEGLIKHGKGQGKFGRAGFGIHMHQSRDFSLFSTGWDTLFAVEGGSGNTFIKGNLAMRGVLSIGEGIAAKSNYMAAGSLTIGSINSSYGGGSGWSANTAGLLLETQSNTEIAVHDSNTRITSLFYYEGDNANRLTVGRDMGWGATGLTLGNSDLYFGKTDHNHTGIGNTEGWAAIENAKDYDALMILGRAQYKNGKFDRRVVRLWDYLEVNGNLAVTGSMLTIGEWTISSEGSNLFIKRGKFVVARFSTDWDRFLVFKDLNNNPPYFFFNKDGNFGTHRG
jgi:hypothetical protein